jgi:cob(I)alamin adenosyltransferase
MAKIYTRAGDAGETALLAGVRVRKDDLRIEAIGSVDELNAAVGVVRMEWLRGGAVPPALDDLLALVQHRLFDLGAELATPAPEAQRTPRLHDKHVAELEAAIDRYNAGLAPLREFILPGGGPAAAQLHWARCVCRRAERRLVALAAGAPVPGQVLRFVNRLSDLLFVLARAANQAAGVPDVVWRQEASGGELGAQPLPGPQGKGS